MPLSLNWRDDKDTVTITLLSVSILLNLVPTLMEAKTFTETKLDREALNKGERLAAVGVLLAGGATSYAIRSWLPLFGSALVVVVLILMYETNMDDYVGQD
jgi:hypothetical protein